MGGPSKNTPFLKNKGSSRGGGGSGGSGGGPKGNSRKDRVGQAMRDALTEMIAADIKDPRVHAPTMLTIARVELNVDMSVARCYVSIVGDDAMADAALEGLNKAAAFMRGPLGRRLSLQHAPELRFIADPSIDVGAKLRAIVLEDEARARAAGRQAGVADPVPEPEPDDDETDDETDDESGTDAVSASGTDTDTATDTDTDTDTDTGATTAKDRES